MSPGLIVSHLSLTPNQTLSKFTRICILHCGSNKRLIINQTFLALMIDFKKKSIIFTTRKLLTYTVCNSLPKLYQRALFCTVDSNVRNMEFKYRYED